MRVCEKCRAEAPELCTLCDDCFRTEAERARIFYPDRRQGKTTEILRLMKEDPRAVMIVGSQAIAEAMGVRYPEFRKRFVPQQRIEMLRDVGKVYWDNSVVGI